MPLAEVAVWRTKLDASHLVDFVHLWLVRGAQKMRKERRGQEEVNERRAGVRWWSDEVKRDGNKRYVSVH